MSTLYPLVPVGWSRTRLRFTIDGSQNGTWGGEPGSSEADVICVRVADFDWDRLQVSLEDPTIRSIEARQLSKLRLRTGDILLEKSGGGERTPVGRVVRWNSVDTEAVTSNFVARMRPAPQVTPQFLTYLFASLYLSGFSHQFIKQNTGIQNLDDSALLDSSVYLPDLATQKAIADFLDRETARIDQLIEKKQQLLELLDEQWDARIERAVIAGIEAGTGLQAVRGELLDTIPEHWRVTTLRRLATDIQTGPFGSQLHSNEYVEDGIPVINPSHMVRRRINADSKIAVDKATWQRLERHAVHEGDVLVARRGELGRCALVTEPEIGWLCGTGSLRIRLRKDLVVPEFLVYALSTRRVSEWLSLQSVGSTMDNLNTGILGRLRLPIPQVPEQRQIVAYLSSVEQTTELLTYRVHDSIDRLKESRSSLITAAVTGQLDISAWTKRGESERRLETVEAAV